MTLKVAYFQPVVLAIDTVPPVEFSKIYSLTDALHAQPNLNDADNPLLSIRGGQQIQVYPNSLNLDVAWLVNWLKRYARGIWNLLLHKVVLMI